CRACENAVPAAAGRERSHRSTGPEPGNVSCTATNGGAGRDGAVSPRGSRPAGRRHLRSAQPRTVAWIRWTPAYRDLLQKGLWRITGGAGRKRLGSDPLSLPASLLEEDQAGDGDGALRDDHGEKCPFGAQM